MSELPYHSIPDPPARARANYSFPHPFILGPGTYYLRVSEIRGVDGDMVVASAEVREYSIKITMG